MQSVNDDMDDLFRRASENYPLNTEGADFNKLLALLEADDNNKAASTIKSTGSARKFLWLLLLIPFMWLCNGNYFNRSKDIATTENTVITQKTNSDKIGSVGNQPSKVAETNHEDAQENIHSFHLQEKKYPSLMASTVLNYQDQNPSLSDMKDEMTLIVDKHQNENDNLLQKNGIEESLKNDPIADKAEVVTKAEDSTNKDIKNTDFDLDKEQSQQAVKNTIKIKREKRFYVGLIAGPDVSTVKFQSVKDIGISKGIIAGFQMNNKLSIEAGIVWDKKYYYTDGQYFSTKNITLPSTVKIESLNGNCDMIELPISLRYVFKSSSKIKWTSTLGLSSYLMKNESYEYMYNNSGSVYQRNKTYNTASEFWFSVMNLGVGYNRKLGKVADLRIEPYLKIPLRGVGIGELPLTSAGITIGLTRKIF